jgi:hypothetical protein
VSEFWFARRFPVGHPRNALAPVSREGWLVAIGFVAAMALGALALLLLAWAGRPWAGVIVFVVMAFAAGAAFIGIAQRKGDGRRTVEDYRQARTGASP